MRPPSRLSAALLAALALFGLAIAPVVHAEVHARESARASAEPAELVKRLAQHGSDFDEVFAELWDLLHKGPLHHSHGPDSQPHGNGSLEHFSVALHAPPAPPPLPQFPLARGALLVAPPPLFVLRYLAPARSQGPPLS